MAEKKVVKIEPVAREAHKGKETYRRVCAYCRVSTEDREQKNSYASQIRYYREWIEKQEGWICAGIFADEAKSGTKIEGRESFQSMMRECRKGTIDYIVTKSLTRFARNTVESITAIRELKALGIGIYFEKERIDTLEQKSERLLTILSAVAQREAENTSMNNRWAVARKFQNGTYKIGTPPYGYGKNKEGMLVPIPKEAFVVRRIVQEYLSGKGYGVIAEMLNEEKILTRRNNKWSQSLIREILSSETYRGNLLYQKTYSTGQIPFRSLKNHGERPQYLIQNDHEALISKQEAERIDSIKNNRSHKFVSDDRGVTQNRYAFSGKIICGICGGRYRRKQKCDAGGSVVVRWECTNHGVHKELCAAKTVREVEIQAAFLRMWNTLIEEYEKIFPVMLEVLLTVPTDPITETEKEELNREIAELRKQSHRLHTILMEGGVDSAAFLQKRNQIEILLEQKSQKLQVMNEKGMFEHEIDSTRSLIRVFREQKKMETFEKEIFCEVIDHVVMDPMEELKESQKEHPKVRMIRFVLKNDLELDEEMEYAAE